jgi:hypothetical protein
MTPASAPFTGDDSRLLARAAQLAAASTGSPIGMVCLEAGATAVWGGAAGVQTSELPAPDGFASRHLVPALAAAPGAFRNVRVLSDHPDIRGFVDTSVDGLVSAATSPIRDAAGTTIGLVGAFDRIPRDWGDQVEQLDAIAALLSQFPPQLRQAGLTHVVAETIQAIERSLGAESIQAVLDVAAQGEDHTLRRQVSEAQASLERASLLRGRLRAALRATPFAQPRNAIFDLVSTAERAVGEACHRHPSALLPVSRSESEIPVAGDIDRAHVAIFRCLAAALDAGHPSDISVHVTSRGLQSDRLDGSVVGELVVSVKGVALGVAALSRVLAGLIGAEPGPGQSTAVSLHLTGGETRLVAPGFEATASAHGTWVTLRWPIDLG